MAEAPNATTQISYYETDLSSLEDHPFRMQNGIYIAVISGSATLNTGAETYRLVPQMELSFISGSLGQCTDRSPDFRVRIFTYTPELFAKITLPIDHIYAPGRNCSCGWMWLKCYLATTITRNSGNCKKKISCKVFGCGFSIPYRNASTQKTISPAHN